MGFEKSTTWLYNIIKIARQYREKLGLRYFLRHFFVLFFQNLYEILKKIKFALLYHSMFVYKQEAN